MRGGRASVYAALVARRVGSSRTPQVGSGAVVGSRRASVGSARRTRRVRHHRQRRRLLRLERIEPCGDACSRIHPQQAREDLLAERAIRLELRFAEELLAGRLVGERRMRAPVRIDVGGEAGAEHGSYVEDATAAAVGVGQAAEQPGLLREHAFALVVEAVGAEIDFRAEVDARALDRATEVAERPNRDGCEMDGLSSLDFYNLPAGTYYLTIDGADASDGGNYDVEVDLYPSNCGDGTLDTFDYEQCDDGNEVDTDGCSTRCLVQPGYSCVGDSPSVCSSNGCGNGTVAGTEQCDDGNNMAGDGCSPTCAEEVGYGCTGSPSATPTPRTTTAPSPPTRCRTGRSSPRRGPSGWRSGWSPVCAWPSAGR